MTITSLGSRVETRAGIGPSLLGLAILASVSLLIIQSVPWCLRQDTPWKCLPVETMLVVCLVFAAMMVRIDLCSFDKDGGTFRHISIGMNGLHRSNGMNIEITKIKAEMKLGTSASRYNHGYVRFHRLMVV